MTKLWVKNRRNKRKWWKEKSGKTEEWRREEGGTDGNPLSAASTEGDGDTTRQDVSHSQKDFHVRDAHGPSWSYKVCLDTHSHTHTKPPEAGSQIDFHILVKQSSQTVWICIFEPLREWMWGQPARQPGKVRSTHGWGQNKKKKEKFVVFLKISEAKKMQSFSCWAVLLSKVLNSDWAAVKGLQVQKLPENFIGAVTLKHQFYFNPGPWNGTGPWENWECWVILENYWTLHHIQLLLNLDARMVTCQKSVHYFLKTAAPTGKLKPLS